MNRRIRRIVSGAGMRRAGDEALVTRLDHRLPVHQFDRILGRLGLLVAEHEAVVSLDEQEVQPVLLAAAE